MTKRPQPSDRRVQTVCLLILALIAVAWAMQQLKTVLVPFVLALFFSQCLTPFIDYLMKRFRLPQMLAVTVAALGGAAVVVGVGFLLASSIAGMSQKQSFAPYQERFDHYTEDFLASRPARLLGIKPGATSESILNLMRGSFGNVFGFVYTQATTILTNTTTVLILMAFLLFGRRRTGRRTGILAEIDLRIQRYISLTVLISILTGLLVGGTLGILQVQFAAGFGFLAFLLNFIPNLGAVVATLLPLPLVFLDPHLSIVVKLLAVLIPSLVQIGIGTFLQPRMMGQSLELHPVVLLLSLLFFAMIWGLAGAFLATPLTAVIKIVFEKIPATRALAAALAGDLEPLAESIDPPPVEPKPPGETRPPAAWEEPDVVSSAKDRFD